MKKKFVLLFVGAMVALLAPLPGFAGDSTELGCISATTDAPVYNPPAENADIRRREGGEAEGSGGASRPLMRASRPLMRASRPLMRASRPIMRGESRPLLRGEKAVSIPKRMVLLAPAHTGLTSHPQPVLRWYISDTWPGDIQFSLSVIKAENPVVETVIAGPDKEGIYQINLADHNVTLEPGVEYEWYLAIVTDPNERSGDFLTSATLKYVKPSDELSKRLTATPENQLYGVYADAGYWYSSIENLSRQIDAGPDDKKLTSHRAALLKQVKLPMAAAYDCK